jgi:hypothetical protein
MVREHVARLWSRRRNQKGMDYDTGRTIIGKFDLGQITRRDFELLLNERPIGG